MTEQLVPPVEALVAIPIAPRMEALKSAHNREVFLKVSREVGIPAESFVAPNMCTEKAWL